MTLNIDLDHISTIEFGVGRKGRHAPAVFYFVRVDPSTKDTLRSMVRHTVTAMERSFSQDACYQPSEKYRSMEYCYLNILDPLAGFFRDVSTAVNLAPDPSFPNDLDTVTCYFARLTDHQDRQVTGFRRAAYFKMLRKRKVLHWMDDTLHALDGAVFKLDADFDLLIDSDRLHILRPAGLEAMANLKDDILAAVKGNVSRLETQMPDIDFAPIAAYARTRIRAARYVAAICRADLGQIDTEALVRQCRTTGVEIESTGGRHRVTERDVMGFLEVLDRRRFAVKLIRGSQEVYRAASRRKVAGL